MSATSSNMISKHYCPKCGSFDLMKLHRNFVQKRILDTPNKLQCKACGDVIKPGAFESNMPCEIPVFLEIQVPVLKATPELVEPLNAVDSQDEVSYSDSQKEIAYEVEDNFKVTETAFSEVNEGSSSVNNPSYGEAPPALLRTGEELVDETILVKEKKGVWPYMVASVLVMLGAAYAFIWMPMTSNTQDADETYKNMSIGKPIEIPREPEVSSLAVVKAEIGEVVVTESKTDAVEVPKMMGQVIEEELLKQPMPEKIKSVLKKTEVTAQKVNNFRLYSDLGAKADKALGGLSGNNREKNSPNAEAPPNELVEVTTALTSNQGVIVPSLTTTVRQYRVSSSAEKNTQGTSAPENRKVLERPKANAEIVKPAQATSFNNKKATALPRASAKDLTKKKSSDAKLGSAESVPVKNIQQDLDNLFN